MDGLCSNEDPLREELDKVYSLELNLRRVFPGLDKTRLEMCEGFVNLPRLRNNVFVGSASKDIARVQSFL